MKKCSVISFFKLTHFVKKSITCINIAKWYSSISSLVMFTISFIIERIYLSIFAFAHHHVAHSFVLLITLFHSIPHVLISSKCLKGPNLVLSLGYSNSFFIILQILSNVLEINMYSIIDFKVFGVKLGDNFFFAIKVERFYNCKHAVEKQRMQLQSTCENNANWGIFHAN